MSGNVVSLAKARAARDQKGAIPRPDALSFVRKQGKERGGGYDYWSVETTGSYITDCDKGKEIGEEYLNFIGAYPTNGNASLLQRIVGSMIDRAQVHGRDAKGIEVGFLQTVNEHALLAAHIRLRNAPA